MKVVCDRLVVCGNYKCGYNDNGVCAKTIIALDSSGACALMRFKGSEMPVKE
jgi:hypothetical protein